MRIIGGDLKGRRVMPPTNLKARPTTDMARESLFNILNNKIDFEETSVLDMFGGTGCISFEFASRGCKRITTIEIDNTNHQFIQKAMKELKVDVVNLIKGDSFKFVESTGAKYDLVFADPPYNHPQLKDIPSIVFEKDILNDEGMLILEHPKEFKFDDNEYFLEHRKYGHVNFTFFKKKKINK